MPFESYLIENDRILYVAFIDPFTEAEMEANWAHTHAIHEKASLRIHTLLNLTELRQRPPTGGICGWRKSAVSHPNSGHMAIVGGNAVTHYLANTVFWMANYDRAKFFETIIDGLIHLRAIIAQELNAAT